ncbi:MAG: hypothetical protein RIE73_02455 [Coleofasciculus sp. C1-SOL-03]
MNKGRPDQIKRTPLLINAVRVAPTPELKVIVSQGAIALSLPVSANP